MCACTMGTIGHMYRGTITNLVGRHNITYCTVFYFQNNGSCLK